MSKKLLSLTLVAVFSMTLAACNKTEEKAGIEVMEETTTEEKAAGESMMKAEDTSILELEATLESEIK